MPSLYRTKEWRGPTERGRAEGHDPSGNRSRCESKSISVESLGEGESRLHLFSVRPPHTSLLGEKIKDNFIISESIHFRLS
jgi:hypothetical protein